ncbi:MAG: hypothetical protein ACR2KT_06950 [Methylocella sp.]
MQTKSILKIVVVAIVVPLALAITVGTAAAGCKSGYVWRDAQNGDGVCVTPEDRAEAKAQNANARNNRVVGGGNYGPNTCRVGYVWREAFGGDVVCVTPYERQKAQKQNAENPQHSLP